MITPYRALDLAEAAMRCVERQIPYDPDFNKEFVDEFKEAQNLIEKLKNYYAQKTTTEFLTKQ